MPEQAQIFHLPHHHPGGFCINPKAINRNKPIANWVRKMQAPSPFRSTGGLFRFIALKRMEPSERRCGQAYDWGVKSPALIRPKRKHDSRALPPSSPRGLYRFLSNTAGTASTGFTMLPLQGVPLPPSCRTGGLFLFIALRLMQNPTG